MKVEFKFEQFTWIDVFAPTEDDLNSLVEEYKLPSVLVHHCMDSERLPKFEKNDQLQFILLRVYDEDSSNDADAIDDLTRKLAIFYNDSFLITIHRKDQSYIKNLKSKYEKTGKLPKQKLIGLLSEIISSGIATYENPIDTALYELERLEINVFEGKGAKPFEIKEGYYLKRKVAVFKRMLRAAIDILLKAAPSETKQQLYFLRVREEAEALYVYTDELVNNINELLQLHISLSNQRTTEASHRINEIVRVLTVFSVFLLPLNLLTGIYGMNFEHMPELKSKYGYPLVLVAMVLVVGGIYFWFNRKGWLKSND